MSFFFLSFIFVRLFSVRERCAGSGCDLSMQMSNCSACIKLHIHQFENGSVILQLWYLYAKYPSMGKESKPREDQIFSSGFIKNKGKFLKLTLIHLCMSMCVYMFGSAFLVQAIMFFGQTTHQGRVFKNTEFLLDTGKSSGKKNVVKGPTEL